jgi:hypothetical protein
MSVQIGVGQPLQAVSPMYSPNSPARVGDTEGIGSAIAAPSRPSPRFANATAPAPAGGEFSSALLGSDGAVLTWTFGSHVTPPSKDWVR